MWRSAACACTRYHAMKAEYVAVGCICGLATFNSQLTVEQPQVLIKSMETVCNYNILKRNLCWNVMSSSDDQEIYVDWCKIYSILICLYSQKKSFR